ncbi:hypothetical protein RFI_34200, partial [Reticulomyxa filosa]
MASSIRKDLGDTSHSLLKVTVGTGVYMMLSMLEENSRSNPKLALKILTYLKAQLQKVNPCELETSSKLPIPSIAENSFDSVHSTLYTIANDSAIHLRVRTMALELLLVLSVTRGTLNTLLSVLYMLLFRFAVDQSLSIRPSLVRLRRMRREVRLDLPSQRNQTLRVSVAPAVGKPRRISIGTDESFLYFHSEKGITKIGTGLNNTNPGFVAGQVREYRGNEKSSICVIGDKIYYRSTNIAPASLIVLSTETLLEIGHVLRNGEGTYATADNRDSEASAASTSKTGDEKEPEHDEEKKE